MKKLMIIVVAALATVCAVAQEKPQRGPHGPGGGPHPAMMAGMWVPRMLSNKENLEKIGVTDEAKCAKIVESLTSLKEEGEKLEQKIRDISREQAQLMRGLLKDKAADPQAVMEKIDEVAKLRAEQGRLSVKSILVLRDNLTPEQLEKASALIHERGRERGAMRRGGRDGESPERGARGDRPRGDRPRGDRPRGERRGKRNAPKEG